MGTRMVSTVESINWPGLLNFGNVPEGRTMSMSMSRVNYKNHSAQNKDCRLRTATGSKMLTADQG